MTATSPERELSEVRASREQERLALVEAVERRARALETLCDLAELAVRELSGSTAEQLRRALAEHHYQARLLADEGSFLDSERHLRAGQALAGLVHAAELAVGDMSAESAARLRRALAEHCCRAGIVDREYPLDVVSSVERSADRERERARLAETESLGEITATAVDPERIRT